VNEQGEYVRRPARWDELPSKSHSLLERLAKARLLIVSQNGDDRMVEVAHEALLRKWPRLRSWLDDAREFLAGKQQLERDLHDWERAPEADKTGALLTGLKLNRARGWLSERPHQLTAEERALVQASIDHAEAAERSKARLRRNITWASIAAALVLACVAGFALLAKNEAQQNLVTANLALAQAAQNKDQWNENLFWLWRAYFEAPHGDLRRQSALRLIGARARSRRYEIEDADATGSKALFGSASFSNLRDFTDAITSHDFNPEGTGVARATDECAKRPHFLAGVKEESSDTWSWSTVRWDATRER
jgi:hypothetical protein